MNWFTSLRIENKTEEQKKAFIEDDGACEHAQADLNLAQVLRREMDSFGVVSSFVCCNECDKKCEEHEGQQSEVCHDCSKTVLMKDAISWKWYDFYAPQGDEPLIICKECKGKEKHQERVKKDREDYESEMGYNDSQNDNF